MGMAEKKDSSAKAAAIPLQLLKTDAAFVKRLFTSSGQRAKGKGASGFRRDVAYAGMRELLGGMSAEQVQCMTPTTEKVYNLVAKAKGDTPKSVDLGDGAQGLWIGASQASHVMLYFHGGGFYGSATVGHVRYMYTLQRSMVKLGHDFAILAATYTLAPGAVYPTQLKQAALALHHLLKVEHRDPSTILLGGDSAGGNLVAALLQHITHPHPQVPAFKLSKPLHAALLISPWVSFDTTAPSFAQNAESDYFGARAVQKAARYYIAADAAHDAYSEPATAPPQWWVDVAGETVQHLMIWAGGGEVLLDGIRGFADMVGAGFQGAADAAADRSPSSSGAGVGADEKPPAYSRFSFVVTPKCAHEEMIIDELAFGRVKGEASKSIEEWVSSVLR